MWLVESQAYDFWTNHGSAVQLKLYLPELFLTTDQILFYTGHIPHSYNQNIFNKTRVLIVQDDN